MSTKYSNTKIHSFIKSFVKSKNGELIEQSNEVFTVKYPNQPSATEYTYEPAVAREKKTLLMTTGSPTFQQILNECLENGVLCQIKVNLKGEFETLLKNYFKDSPFTCQDCTKVTVDKEWVSICEKTQVCHHQINNGKIVSVKMIKNEPVRYYQFFFSATFRNKLRLNNDDLIILLMDEEGNIVSTGILEKKIFCITKKLRFKILKPNLNRQFF